MTVDSSMESHLTVQSSRLACWVQVKFHNSRKMIEIPNVVYINAVDRGN